MAKFLDTQAISHELMKLIREAKDRIVLVSPYLQVNSQIQERLKTKSALGVLSEIVIVYREARLDQVEFNWMKEITDLKVFEKKNLHAKCYLNEDKAIICSMNLYDYSQQNNIEMGIMILRETDKDAYNEVTEEINNLKINGNRKKIDSLESFNKNQNAEIDMDESIKYDNKPDTQILSFEEQMHSEALKEWRLIKSREDRIKAFLILTNKEIEGVVKLEKIDMQNLNSVLGTRKVKQYGREIFEVYENLKKYTIGKVVNVKYQSGDNEYDKVKLKILKSSEEVWFDTVKELPMKNKHVAVMLNKNWFNYYLYLD